LVLVGFRHDHQETLRLNGGDAFLKDTILIVTPSGWIRVLISVPAGTLVLGCSGGVGRVAGVLVIGNTNLMHALGSLWPTAAILI
jgi:hypothetical protein